MKYLSKKASFLLAPLFLLSCQASTDENQLHDEANSDVALLEANSAIPDNEFVLTVSSDLLSDDFREQIRLQIKATFLGFLLTSESNAFTGSLKVFSGKYLQEPNKLSSPWPREEFKDDNYQEVRSGVLETKLITSDATNSLRVYYFPARSGFENDQFKTSHALLIAHIDAKSGERKFRIYKDEKVYALKSTAFPKSSEETTLTSHLKAGGKMKADVMSNGRLEHNKIIPTKLYAEKTFVPGRQDSDSPLGDALSLDSNSLKNILQNFLDKKPQAPEDLAAVNSQF